MGSPYQPWCEENEKGFKVHNFTLSDLKFWEYSNYSIIKTSSNMDYLE